MLNPKWLMPLKAKVFEALSVLADARITLVGGERAEVVSSAGDKTYIVEWTPDFKRITSNDSGSYWQGYLGYPIIAALLMKQQLPFSQSLLEPLAGIPWRSLNKQYKDDHDKAVESVLIGLEERGIQTRALRQLVDEILERLSELELEKFAERRRRPPL